MNKTPTVFARVVLFAMTAVLFASHVHAANPVTASGNDGLTSTRVDETAGATSGTQITAPLQAPSAGTLGAIALNYARAKRAALGLSPLDDFDIQSTFHSTDGNDHVRLMQRSHGVKVWNAVLAVHINSGGSPYLLDGNVVQVPDTFNVTPLINAPTAQGIAKADYAAGPPAEPKGPRFPLAAPRLPAAQAGVSVVYQSETQELVIYPTAQKPVLAWHVYFYTPAQAGLPAGRWNYFIDAGSGAIIHGSNAIGHVLAQASGPGGNPNVSRAWVNQLDVETTATPGVYVMDTARLQSIDAVTGLSPTGPLNPISTDPAINDAHGFTEVVLDMMLNWFGHNSLDDKGYKVISFINVGNQSAQWIGTAVQYGNGPLSPLGVQQYYPWSGGIDIVGHEMSHGFTQFHSVLGYFGEPGTVNESFGDIHGTLSEFYYSPATANFDIGEAIVIPGVSPAVQGTAIRYMCDPVLDGISIGDAILFDTANANLYDPHYTSGIINKAFCRAAKRLSSGSPTGTATQAGVQRAGAAWVEANAHYWISSSTMTQACQGVYDAATALGYTATELTALRDSWADVGLFCAGGMRPCDETLTTATGTIQSPNYPADYPDNYVHTWCVQPASGIATLTFNDFNVLDAGFDWVEVRDATNNLLSRTSGTTPPPPATSSLLRVTFGTDQPSSGVPHGRWQATWTAAAAGPATHFTVSTPAAATAGTPLSVTVTALDANNNPAIGYTGTVHFTSSDLTAVLPANATLTNGNGVFTAILNTAGSQTITATDTVAASISGMSSAITVSAAAATHFSVSAPALATSGTAISFTVTALDASNNTVAGYTGTVHFTSSDLAAVLPANATLTNGVGTFAATLKTAGNQIITASDSVAASISGTSSTITVSAAAPTHFSVVAPASTTAGTALSVTITALDASNNTVAGYTGTVHFTSSDLAAVLPVNVTLANGSGVFFVTLNTAGSQTITASDTVSTAISGTSSTITVSAAAATHFSVTAPATATAGTPLNFTVAALDPSNNTVAGYTGTVHFTSSDPTATLPANATLANGVGTFAATLNTAGTQTISATDTAVASISGTSTITVGAGAATHFSVVAPASATAGMPLNFTVTALDASNNTVAGYTGMVHFTSTDTTAILPANSALTNGMGTFSATFSTAGNQTITATDAATTSINGTSNAISISAVQAAADLTITKTHMGNFTQGKKGATYTITVTNKGLGATSGSVTVTDALPSGLTATSLRGAGWSCTLGAMTCIRSDALMAGGSYPAITLAVKVAATAPPSVINTATVSGGGDINISNNSASDPTAITLKTDRQSDDDELDE